MKALIPAFVLLCAISIVAQERPAAGNDKYAPLPDKVVNAKTVFYVNDTGNSRFGDDMYREIRKWNHWQVVTDRAKADLVFVLSQQGSGGVISTGTVTATGNTASGTVITAPINPSPGWYLHLVDSNTGEELWTARHTLGGRLWQSWGSVARSLLSDLQKRMK